MKHYVLGFAFNAHDQLVLIEKQRPEFMKGKLNGVGGKVETFDDGLISAMIREFREEAGVLTTTDQWNYFGFAGNTHFIIAMYWTTLTDIQMDDVVSETDEAIILYDIRDLREIYGTSRVMHNLGCLVELAISNKNGCRALAEIKYTNSEQ